jgi:hypothetical protein
MSASVHLGTLASTSTCPGVPVYSREFWLGTAERVLWTFLQALAAAGAADGVLNLAQMNWREALGIAAGAALLCFVKCLGAALVPPKGTPATLAPEPAAGRHARPDQ